MPSTHWSESNADAYAAIEKAKATSAAAASIAALTTYCLPNLFIWRISKIADQLVNLRCPDRCLLALIEPISPHHHWGSLCKERRY